MNSILKKTYKLYIDSYSGHPREIWILIILTFINRTGTMVLPFLTIYLTSELGFSLKDAGWLAGAFGLGSFAGAYLGGMLSDRIGSKWVILGSLILSGIMFIIIQFPTDFASLFILFFIASLFGEAYRPAGNAYVAEYVEPERRGRTMAFLRLAVNLGMSAGPFLGGFIAVGLGYNWLFWLDGITCILAGLYFLGKINKLGTGYQTEESTTKTDTTRSSTPPYKNADYLLFLFASFLMGLAFNQWFNSIPVFIKSEWGYNESYIGTLMAINCVLIVAFEMPLIHQLEKLNRIKFSVLTSLFFMSISFLPFLLPGALYLCIIGIVLFTIGEILYFPFNNSIPLNMSPPSRIGEYMSWYWMAWSLTRIVGPPIGFSIADEMGFNFLWISMVILVLVSFAINYIAASRVIH